MEADKLSLYKDEEGDGDTGAGEILDEDQDGNGLISLNALKKNSNRLRVLGEDTNVIAVDPVWRRIQMEMEGILRMQKLTKLLINGETGAGKELIARTFHALRPVSSRGKFIPINCGAMPAEIFESELFGHMKGAFTGAVTDKRGLFETAKGGVIFLDEIGDLPITLQTKLLRVLQERTIRPVGGVREIDVGDVFVMCATNRDLANLMTQGKFRQDLFYRINMVSITVPPLRERRGDIPVLVGFFMSQYCDTGEPQYISSDALSRLMAYSWPGNVRELENIIAKALVSRNGRDNIISILDLKDVPSIDPDSEQDTISSFRDHELQARRYVDRAKRDYVEAILKRTRGNVSAAAKIADMDRTNFKRLCRRSGVRIRDFQLPNI